MKKDSIIFLLHILDSILLIEKYIKNKNKKTFVKDSVRQDAVVRRLEVIGEAVKNLPSSFKKKYKDVPWQQASDMRNFLIHEYFGVNSEVVYKTIKSDLPKFKKQIKKILKEYEQKALV